MLRNNLFKYSKHIFKSSSSLSSSSSFPSSPSLSISYFNYNIKYNLTSKIITNKHIFNGHENNLNKEYNYKKKEYLNLLINKIIKKEVKRKEGKEVKRTEGKEGKEGSGTERKEGKEVKRIEGSIKLSVRERVNKLIDNGTLFLEIGLFGGYEMYDDIWLPCAGIVTGIGIINGYILFLILNYVIIFSFL